MHLIYSTAVRLYGFLLGLASLAGNTKAKLWIDGRKSWRNKLKQHIGKGSEWVWFHCASLGEFEQGRPLLESYRLLHPELKVLLTFFSPSGYEIRKNYSGADAVVYLPLDTASNAQDFVSIVNPKSVFFIKYEFWFNFLNVLNQRGIPVYFVSSIFREGQWLLKPMAKPLFQQLKNVRHFFVQDDASRILLERAGIHHTTVSGDTRFDRVSTIADATPPVYEIDEWKGVSPLIVAGSTWPKDESILLDFIAENTHGYKLLLAPHLVDPAHIDKLKILIRAKKLDGCTAFYSSTNGRIERDKQIYIVDHIGLLSRLYRHATITYVGGGFGAGIHNTLEAAVYGKPVLFGPNFKKFKEARELIQCDAAFSIDSLESFKSTMKRLSEKPDLITSSGNAARAYVQSNKGATDRILKKL